MKKLLIVILIAFISVSTLSIMFTFQASSRFRNFIDDDDDDDDDEEYDTLKIDIDNLRIVNFAIKLLMQLSEELKLDVLDSNRLNFIHC